RIEGRFCRPKFSKFPVKFPVSREFGKRKVSARLPAPPHSLKCREIRLDCSGNCRKWAQFRNSCSQHGPEKVSCSMLQASFAAIFSGGHPSSPVSKTPSGECNAITNRRYSESSLTLSAP